MSERKLAIAGVSLFAGALVGRLTLLERLVTAACGRENDSSFFDTENASAFPFATEKPQLDAGAQGIEVKLRRGRVEGSEFQVRKQVSTFEAFGSSPFFLYQMNVVTGTQMRGRARTQTHTRTVTLAICVDCF